ncbi:uncharacterized protein LOC113970334 isoform X3 [Neopelma chrysocephalum]|uniref:uncharacterized protein LOC113970334 isoform X3 n=1 Tax=Neopelma chrysocephalum TaxID=114329 RepID=UPI000FCD00E5|nr:uncharacterized protein LOC113970334 isoform X3 [Neopelma chrysocephalum]
MMEMFKERPNPNSQPDNILSQWEAEEIQELSQWEDVEYEDLSSWGFERYLEALQWGEEKVHELFQWEFERYQELSQWGDERVQELPQCNNQRIQELSQSEGETVQELSPGVDVKVQELSQWEGKRDKELSQAEDDSDKVLCQWEDSMEQELSEGEVRVDPELSEGEVKVRGDPVLSQEGDNIYQELLWENWEHIPNHTIWVNLKYPELLQNLHCAPQGSAQAAASPASWERVKAAGAESPGPAPHSPCCPPSPSPCCQEGAVGGAELPGPQTEQWSFAKEEEEERKYSLDQELSQWKEEELCQADPEDDSDKVLCRWEDSTDQELSWCEVRGDPELSQGEVSEDIELSEEGDDRDQELSQENYECITICTIWVNPKYPQLLQNSHPAPKGSAQAAASPGSGERVPEAGTENQVPRKRPSRSRRVLQALRRLFRIPCMAGRPED